MTAAPSRGGSEITGREESWVRSPMAMAHRTKTNVHVSVSLVNAGPWGQADLGLSPPSPTLGS